MTDHIELGIEESKVFMLSTKCPLIVHRSLLITFRLLNFQTRDHYVHIQFGRIKRIICRMWKGPKTRQLCRSIFFIRKKVLIIIFDGSFYTVPIKFGLSEKHTKFEKIFLMALTNQLIFMFVYVYVYITLFSNAFLTLRIRMKIYTKYLLKTTTRG